MTDGRKLLEDICAGLDGVTPGPWHYSGDATIYALGYDGTSRLSAVFSAGWVSSPHSDGVRTPAPEREVTASHFARCSPEAMRAIKAAWDEDREALDSAEACLWSIAKGKETGAAGLRHRAKNYLKGRTPIPIAVLQHKLSEAIARAEKAEAKNTRLREALTPFADEASRRSFLDQPTYVLDEMNIGGCGLKNIDLRRARAALEDTK